MATRAHVVRVTVSVPNLNGSRRTVGRKYKATSFTRTSVFFGIGKSSSYLSNPFSARARIAQAEPLCPALL
jgi:hypothetical protein